MAPKFLAVCLLLLTCGCSPPGSGNTLYGQMVNTREFGTVVSVNQGMGFTVTNLDGAITGGVLATAGDAAGAAVSSSSMLSPFSGTFSSIGNLFGSNYNTTATPDTVTHLEYVIDKDNGQRVTIAQVPEAEEIILYPGQRAMIQSNGKYLRVYPGDVEHRRGD
jgi:outer membrane lipoprotein SlyB